MKENQTFQERVKQSRSLEELLSVISSEKDLLWLLDVAVPTFGGPPPKNASMILSWDPKSYLILTGGCYQIISRCKWKDFTIQPYLL